MDTILSAGTKPLMCLCFKPRVLFPQINRDIVEPNDYEAWEQLIFNLLRYYRDPRVGMGNFTYGFGGAGEAMCCFSQTSKFTS